MTSTVRPPAASIERTIRHASITCEWVGGNRCNVCLEEHRSGLFADGSTKCENFHEVGQVFLVEEVVRTTLQF